jgi:hypothetical protein
MATESDADRTLDPEMRHVLEELRGAIWWLRVAAVVVFAFGVAITAVVVWLLPSLTQNASERIAESGNSATVMIFELLRGAAFAAAVTSILFGVLTLGRACLDQATRFQKRLIAAHFLNYVLHIYGDEVRSGDMKLTEIVNFLKSWSENVESAFSGVKFGSRHQRTELRAGDVAASTESGNANLAPAQGSAV